MQFQGGPRNLILGVLFLVGCILILAKLTDYTRQTAVIPYSAFLEKVEQNQIKQAQLNGQEIFGKLKEGSNFETVAPEKAKPWELLKSHQVEFSVVNNSNQFNIWYDQCSFLF